MLRGQSGPTEPRDHRIADTLVGWVVSAVRRAPDGAARTQVRLRTPVEASGQVNTMGSGTSEVM